MKFIDNIPTNFLRHRNTLGFVRVLDALHDHKKELVDTYATSFIPTLVEDTSILKLMVSDYGNIPTATWMNRAVYESIVLNANDLLEFRGTRKGLRIFCEVICLGYGIPVFEGLRLPTYISLDDLDTGYLPNDNDIQEVYFDKPRAFIYLLEDLELHMKHVFSMGIATPFHLDSGFHLYLSEHIFRFLPMIDPINSEITLHLFPLGFDLEEEYPSDTQTVTIHIDLGITTITVH